MQRSCRWQGALPAGARPAARAAGRLALRPRCSSVDCEPVVDTPLQPAAQRVTQLSLADVLANVRAAVRGRRPLEHAPSGARNAMVFGEGVHMGCHVGWAFIWRPDGAFYEEVRSKHLTYKWGHNGGARSQCWEVDPSGVSKVLERDDHEATLLAAFIRSGNWLVPELAAARLEVDLEMNTDGTSISTMALQYTPELRMPPVATLVDASPPGGPVVAAGAAAEQQGSGRERRGSARGTPVVAAAALDAVQDRAAAPDPPHPPVVAVDRYGVRTDKLHLVLRLKGGKMLARVAIDLNTWQPAHYQQPLCSDSESWVYQHWQNWTQTAQELQQEELHRVRATAAATEGASAADVFYPGVVTHHLFRDCAHVYTTHGALTRGPEVSTAYQLPACPPVPIDVQWLDGYSERVPAWQTPQGHLLVEAHINGRRAGWMILDTGASGYVIEPSVANSLRLPVFGNLRIAGVSGKVATRYRRASQLRLGPLLLSDPVLMEMGVSQLVGNFHDRVVGIAGFDVFRRSCITLPCHNTRLGLTKASSALGQVHCFRLDEASAAQAARAGHPWPPSSATQQQLADTTAVQQALAAAGAAAAVASHATAGAAGGSSNSSSSSSSAIAVSPPRRRRFRPGLVPRLAGRSRSGHATASSAAAAASTAPAAVQELVQERPPPSQQQQSQDQQQQSQSQNQQQQQQQPPALPLGLQAQAQPPPQQPQQQLPPPPSQQQQQQPIELPPLPALSPSNALLGNLLIEVLLQKPVVRTDRQLDDGYIWQPITMIASLPHVELEFVVPGSQTRHRSLFMVDSGAGGAEIMFHSRAARELGLLDHQEPQYRGWGQGEEQRFVSGVLDGSTANGPHGASGNVPPPPRNTMKPQPTVCSQAGRLPEVLIRGQAGACASATGALVLRDVRALFNRTGGLDISLYSAGMVCVDLLSRTQVVLDYTNKRIGWKRPPAAPRQQVGAPQQRGSEPPGRR